MRGFDEHGLLREGQGRFDDFGGVLEIRHRERVALRLIALQVLLPLALDRAGLRFAAGFHLLNGALALFPFVQRRVVFVFVIVEVGERRFRPEFLHLALDRALAQFGILAVEFLNPLAHPADYRGIVGPFGLGFIVKADNSFFLALIVRLVFVCWRFVLGFVRLGIVHFHVGG